MSSHRRRLVGAVVGLAAAGATAGPVACGELGDPAFVGDDSGPIPDTRIPVVVPTDAEAEGEAEAATATLRGRVLDPSGKPIATALVAIEIGGLDQVNPGSVGPDGATVPTLKIDPYYRLGAMTDERGAFELSVPEGEIGVHVYAQGYYCGVPDAGVIATDAGVVTIQPDPLPPAEAGAAVLPSVTGFSISPQVAVPGDVLTLSANVQAASRNDPLSNQILAIEPTSHFAGVFAPPTPASVTKGYPDGVYGRLIAAPSEPGKYTFYMIAVSRDCVVSAPATDRVLVTITGDGGLDAEGLDASDGG